MKKVLVVVDMQNDFIDGSLGSPGAQAIVPRVVKKIEQYLKDDDGYVVILTQDTHFEDYLDTLEGQKLPIKHCTWSSDGWKLKSSIKNLVSNYDEPKVYIIPKFTFGSLELIARIFKIIGGSFSNLESIELCGLVTNICVISNAMILKSTFNNTPIFVDSSCCAGTSIEAHNQALELMKNSLQIEVI